MTLEQIFYLSQSVASIAVVGSLIYLGLQVRSAERSQRAIMQQGRADRAVELTRFRGHLMVRFGGVFHGRQECSIYAGV